MDYITKMLQLFFNEDWFLCRTVYKIAGWSMFKQDHYCGSGNQWLN
jgi:hypothetical protein